MTQPVISLNPKQNEAVQHVDGPLLILAGAGSGKTRVLVERMVNLVEHERVSPWHIFAVTFTNKAAREMKERVIKALGPAAQNLWISTFHSSCLRMLRKHSTLLGYAGQFAIYDDQDQQNVIKKVIAAMNLNDKMYQPKSVQYCINHSKNEGIDADRYPTGGDFYQSKIQEIYKAYQEELKRNQAMDFGDLIHNVIKLFVNHPDVLGEYQNQFRYIMVDEYQDTNLCQYKLIGLLANKYKNVCVVGDDDQSIYKFRGAEVKNILDFQKDFPDAKVIRLEQNYRSTQNILNAANAVVRRNKGRMGKELWTQNQEGELIRVFGAPTEKEEAQFVTRTIEEKRKEFHLRDIAIFYRTNAQSRSLEDELRRCRIPYRIYGGIKFYERAEIKDVMAYLKVLLNPADMISLKRVINTPARGIGKTTIDKLEQVAAQNQVSLWDVLLMLETDGVEIDINQGTLLKLKSFVALIQKINTARVEMPLDEFLPYLYEQSGYWQMLTEEKNIEAEGRKDNLKELTNVLEEFIESNENATIEMFLDQVALASDVDKLDQASDFVTLMTIHLAKGLEFPVVFLVGMEEGLFPHMRSLDKQEDLEEERRLCYVGMTRAKRELFMTFAGERRLFGAPQYNFPSRFLEEIPAEFVDMLATPRAPSAQPTASWQRPSSGFGTRTPFANAGAAHRVSTPSQATQSAWSNRAGARPAPASRANPNERTIDVEYSQSADAPLKRGTRVRHAVFGDGHVLGFEGSSEQLKVNVKFMSGIQKKLLFKHSHLTVLQ